MNELHQFFTLLDRVLVLETLILTSLIGHALRETLASSKDLFLRGRAHP